MSEQTTCGKIKKQTSDVKSILAERLYLTERLYSSWTSLFKIKNLRSMVFKIGIYIIFLRNWLLQYFY